MEISETIKNAALTKLNLASPDARLSKILKDLGKLEVKKFIAKKNVIIKNKYNQLHDLHIESVTKDEILQVDLLAGHYKAIFQTIDAAFQKASLKKLLPFLMTHGYFQVSFSTIFEVVSPTNTHKKALSLEILKLLKTIKQELSVKKGASYHENQMLEKANEAVKFRNIEGFYRLVRAMEMSGMGLHGNFLLEKLIVFLFYLDNDELLNFLQSFSEPFPIVYYLQEFGLDELISLTSESIRNEWLSFELVRLIDSKTRNSFTSAHQEAVKRQLEIIYHNDTGFFKQTMKYFEGSNLVMAAFGAVCNIFPTTFIKDVFENSFTLDQYNNRREAHDALLFNLEKSVDDTKLRIILADVHNLWQTFTASLLRNEDYYQFDTLITDFADYVAAHYFLNCSDADIIQHMNQLIDSIKYLDSEWHISKSKQITKYHWYSSMLYILSVSYKNRGMTDAAIKDAVESLKNNKIQIARNKTRNIKLAIELTHENV